MGRFDLALNRKKRQKELASPQEETQKELKKAPEQRTLRALKFLKNDGEALSITPDDINLSFSHNGNSAMVIVNMTLTMRATDAKSIFF